MRFPKARDTDPDEYNNRLDFLANDTAHLAVPLLRAACDRAAQSARGMPYASEIIACAAAIVEDRQRAAQPVADARRATVNLDAHAERAREYNRAYAAAGSPFRFTDAMEPFRIGDIGERRATRDDGSVIEPWFKFGENGDTSKNAWHPPHSEDTGTLNAAYVQHGSVYRVVRGEIVEA